MKSTIKYHKQYCLSLASLLLITLHAQVLLAQTVKMNVELSPMGSFTAESKSLTGFYTKNGDKFLAENIVLQSSSLKTGIDLRDEHLHKNLEATKYPSIVLKKAVASKGKGEGILQVKAISKKINFTYTENKNSVHFSFKISMKDFGFKEISYLGVSVNDEVSIEGELKQK